MSRTQMDQDKVAADIARYFDAALPRGEEEAAPADLEKGEVPTPVERDILAGLAGGDEG